MPPVCCFAADAGLVKVSTPPSPTASKLAWETGF